MAEFLAERQVNQLCTALESVRASRGRDLATVIVSGEGEYLARRILARNAATSGCDIISLSSTISPEIAEAACAYAVAVLAAETT